MTIRRRAPAPSKPQQPLQRPFKGDPELRLLPERAKYAMLGGSKVVVGTNIASHGTDEGIMVLWRSAAAPPHTPNHHTAL